MKEAEAQKYLAKLEAQNTILQKRLQTTEAQNKKLDYNMRNLTDAYNVDLKRLQEMVSD